MWMITGIIFVYIYIYIYIYIYFLIVSLYIQFGNRVPQKLGIGTNKSGEIPE